MIAVIPTRCSYNYRAISAVYENLDSLRSCFASIRENSESWDNSSIHQSGALLGMLNTFDFVFFILLFNLLLPLIDLLFKKLQNSSLLLQSACSSVKQTLNDLKKLRNVQEFTKLFTCAKLKYNNDSDSSKTRSSSVFLSDSCKVYHYKLLYFDVIDMLLENIETRFKDFEHLQFYLLLQKENFSEYHKDFPLKIFNVLQESVYKSLFDFYKLKAELIVVYSSSQFLLNACDMLQLIYECDLTETLPEVTKLLKLTLILPVTTVPVERSFSSLNRIETVLRTTMEEDRLSNLLIISIEKELANDINHEKVIQRFSEMKDRRIKLLLK